MSRQSIRGALGVVRATPSVLLIFQHLSLIPIFREFSIGGCGCRIAAWQTGSNNTRHSIRSSAMVKRTLLSSIVLALVLPACAQQASAQAASGDASALEQHIKGLEERVIALEGQV